MKCSVYILKSSSGKYYIGSTTNLVRLKQHRNNQSPATKRLKTYDLVFSKDYDKLSQARIIENKSWKRKDFIDKIVEDQDIKIAPW